MISALIGILLGIVSNIIANWLQPNLDKYKKIVIGVFVALGVTTILLSANFGESKSVNSNDNVVEFKPDKTLILVFCDLSPSQDNEAVEMVIMNCQKIVEANLAARIIFYPISSNQYSKEIIEFDPDNAMKFYMKDFYKSIREKLSQFWNASKTLEKNTCILKSFEVAYNKFKQFDPRKVKFQLVFISDMMENCRYDFGNISLSNKSEVLRSIDIVSYQNTNFNLAKMGVDISVIMTVSRQLPIDERLHREFWKAEIKAWGYNDSLFNRISFGTDIPDYLRSN